MLMYFLFICNIFSCFSCSIKLIRNLIYSFYILAPFLNTYSFNVFDTFVFIIFLYILEYLFKYFNASFFNLVQYFALVILPCWPVVFLCINLSNKIPFHFFYIDCSVSLFISLQLHYFATVSFFSISLSSQF